MIRFLSILTLLLVLQLPVWAQHDVGRTTATKIADLLATQPAANAVRLQEAFAQLALFTDADMTGLFLQLKPQGGDNARLEYIANSYSYYVMQPGKEDERIRYIKGALGALDRLDDRDSKGFVINMLANAGRDEAVPGLSPYLRDEYLVDRAARALANIKTPVAGQALLEALSAAEGKAKLSIVEALGDVGHERAEQALLGLIAVDDSDLQRVSLYALAKLALPSSAGALKNAAAHVNYAYDEANATASYIAYLDHLVDKGEQALAGNESAALLKAGEGQVTVRIAALGLLARIHGKDYLPQLLKAGRDQDIEYAVEASRLALPLLSGQTLSPWSKGLKKARPESQAVLIAALANEGDSRALPTVKWAVQSKDADVRRSAILAYSKLEGERAVPELLKLLPKAGETDREAIEEALLTVRGPGLPELLVAGLSGAAPGDQALLVRVLANRGAKQAFPAIGNLLSSQDTVLRAAAYAALPHVSARKHLSVLMGQLPIVDLSNEETKAVQKAIVVAINEGDQQRQDIQSLLEAYKAADAKQKMLYLPVFSGLGGDVPLEQLAGDLHSAGDSGLHRAIVLALADWKDASALTELIKLSRTVKDADQYDGVLKGVLRIVKQSGLPAEQCVLILRDAMETSQALGQKRLILRGLEDYKTYNALVFAGKYLDTAELRAAAAMTVLHIALGNTDLYGAEAKELMGKTVQALSGNDSDYLKQALLKHIAELPKEQGFVPLFNGKDLDGWKGLVDNPIKRGKMDARSLASAQQKSDALMREGWYVKDGMLIFNGKGDNIATVRQYGDFELLVDWKLSTEGKDGDAGIYLRGTPQVQIWDTSRVQVGAQVGSGGLYNNQVHESKPLLVADNALGEWNTFRILMKGDRVTVYLNGKLVTDSVVMENYWDRSLPIFPREQIELQAHGTVVAYRDIYIRELPSKERFKLSNDEEKEGFKVLFDGTNMDAWMGNTTAYSISEEGTLAIYPTEGSGGNLYSKDEFADFVYRFEFRLTPGANNGIGLRAPMEGDAAYTGMEIQVLDDGADIYSDIKPYQFTGSVYGVIPAKPGHLRPVGEWNEEEIYIKGNKVRVILNGTVILDGDIWEASKNGTIDGRKHPGLQRKSGHLAFLGHGSEVHFRNMRIKEL